MRVSNRKIPWQDRERLGSLKAFFMTIVEAFINPMDYYAKLLVGPIYTDPLILCFYCSSYLTGPLIPRILLLPSFLAIIFILLTTPALFFVLAFVIKRILFSLGEEISYDKTFYVLAYASPAFVLGYIPHIGFGMAAIAVVVLVAIGQIQVFKISFAKTLATLIVVPLLVLIPLGVVRFAQDFEKNHPITDIQMQAQKVLAVISAAAENYASSHDGQYPTNSEILVSPAKQYLVRDYCGTIMSSYKISCDFRNYGYYLMAEPQGWQGRGKRFFYVTTGGKLREE